ncbi:hypothetical protein PG997_013590 [Apiospora hydei]|uniref:Peptidase S53 domain-containing protein n=1 Tax=Apiospora hydei TaxID=1337664 RepID=A0ABR1VA56_9PEZI
MRFLLIETVFALAALTFASPASRRVTHQVTHEKRHQLPEGWAKREKVDGRAVLPLRIGLKQRNLDRADELLDQVSHPKSGNYAKHWSPREVADMFAPSQESVDSVSVWLAESGIDPSRIVVSGSKAWISVNATVSEVESLIKTDYHVYEHTSGHLHVASGSYSLPAYLSEEHVDFIMPTLHFDAKIMPGRKGSGDQLRKRQQHVRTRKLSGPYSGAAKTIGQNTGSLAKLGAQIGMSKIITKIENCDTQTTPDCLRALYRLPHGTSAQPGNSYGVVEYTPQGPRLLLLPLLPNRGRRPPLLDSIDGGSLPQNLTNRNLYVESSLDLEYAMSLVYPQKVTLYQVGDMLGGGSFNNFLDALDGSYCTYAGGDDPEQDGVYPNPEVGGYKGPADCGTSKAANVISTSYGYNEAALTEAYQKRQCYEYMKLGLQGVTVLYSSGDFGVAGNNNRCIGNGKFVNGTSGAFNPSFPGTCPYITSVGATQVPTGTNILDAIASKVQPEVACETIIKSGYLFVDTHGNPFFLGLPPPRLPSRRRIPLPDKLPAPYGADRYNNTGRTRAFPDVSANGANYVVAVLTSFHQVFGTSASTPTFGAVITQINERRLALGKGPVGFLNPALYAHPDVMNDITRGANPGCGTGGFAATPGWDPVTGLGTPNFPKMLDMFLRLP